MDKSYISISSFDDINYDLSVNENQTQNDFNTNPNNNNNANENTNPNNNENHPYINSIIEALINKKISKENEFKEKISQNKKNILNQFYKTTNNFYNTNSNINNNSINHDHEEIKQKYKNERKIKKSSFFKSEDLFISKTDIVNINEPDKFSPIKPENYLNDDKRKISKNKKRILKKQKSFNNKSLTRQKTVDFSFKDENKENIKSNGNLIKNIKYKGKNLSMQFVSSVVYLNNCSINYNIINTMNKKNKHAKENMKIINKKNSKNNFFKPNKTTSFYNNYENNKNSVLMKNNDSFNQNEHTFNLIKNDITLLTSMRNLNQKKNITNNKIIKHKSIGNKFSILNTLLNNKLIIFPNNEYQIGAVEKMKTLPNSLVYFLYVDKINEGYSFKGIYKKGFNFRHTCNKIYGISIAPLTLSYEKFYILVENEEKNFNFSNLNKIDNPSFTKTILLIKSK